MEKAKIWLSRNCPAITPDGWHAQHSAEGTQSGKPYVGRKLMELFGPGCFGTFAFSGDALIGYARALSDTLTTTWLAEVRLAPGQHAPDVEALLLDDLNNWFRKTALYCSVPSGSIDIFVAAGIRPKAKLIACCRQPGPPASEADALPTVVFHEEKRRCSPNAYNEIECASFGVPDEGTWSDDSFQLIFGKGTFGFFAETPDGRLVGFVRAFSDDVGTTYIAEVCVHPDWQRRGIGRALIGRLVRRFSHTAIWTEAFPNALPLFSSWGIAADPAYVGCSRRPLD